MNKIKSFVLLCIIAAIAFAMYKFTKETSASPENSIVSKAVASSIMISEEEAKKLSDMYPLHLYFFNENEDLLKQEIRYIGKEDLSKGPENTAGIVLNEIIKGPSPDMGLRPSLDSKAKIASISMEDHKIEIIFNETSFGNHIELSVMSIVNSLCDIEGIDEVYIKTDDDNENQRLNEYGLDEKLTKDMH